MFESFKFNSAPKSESEKELLLNYAEVARNRKKIEERRLREQAAEDLKKLGKEVEIQEGVEKARKELEKEFEHTV
ncbi:MAG: hypothetical protein M1155_02005 [Patescibacteria group bacterium]|nr:hypothetical protein [Patescibacteria group bacterium]